MLWKALPILIALIALLAVACNSGPEDEVKDWYYEDSGFNSADFLLLDCGAGRTRLQQLEAAISALPDRLGSDRWRQRASALRQSFLADTGWSEVEARFCSGRIAAYDDPSLCAFFLLPMGSPRALKTRQLLFMASLGTALNGQSLPLIEGMAWCNQRYDFRFTICPRTFDLESEARRV